MPHQTRLCYIWHAMRCAFITSQSARVCLAIMVLCLAVGCADRKGNRLVEAGVARIRSGQTDEAVKLLKKAVLSYPDNPSAHANLGIAYWKNGRTRDAAEAMRRAAARSPEDPVALELLADVLLADGQSKEARDALAQASAIDPNSCRILTARAALAMKSDDAAAASVLLRRALELEPDYPPALYNMAKLLERAPAGDADAKEFYERFLRVTDNSRYRRLAGRALAQIEATLDVTAPPVETHRTGTPPPPDPAGPKLAEAAAAIRAGEQVRALITLKDAVKQHPGSADALWMLTTLYRDHLEMPDRASDAQRIFKERFPGDPRNGPDTDAARATEGMPPDQAAEHHYRRAIGHVAANEIQLAIASYRRALVENETHFQAAFALGLACRLANDHKSARAALVRAAKIKPDAANVYYMLGVVCREMGDQESAAGYLKQGTRIKPDYAKAHYLLGLIYIDSNRPSLARQSLNRCLRTTRDETLAARARTHLATIQ